MVKIKKLEDRTAIENPIEDFEKIREKKKKDYLSLLEEYAKTYGHEGGEGVEFKDRDGNVKVLEAPIHKEDRESLANFLADAKTYYAKYTQIRSHLSKAARSSKLEEETEKGLHKFIETSADIADHKDLVGLPIQDLYGRLIEIGAKQNINYKEMGRLWDDAQKNDDSGRKAREALINLIISDIQNQLTKNSLEYNTKHLVDADYDRIGSYVAALGQTGKVLSRGDYAPHLDEITNLDEAKGELLKNILNGYVINPKSPHIENPELATYHTEAPKAIKGGEEIKVADLQQYKDDMKLHKRTPDYKVPEQKTA